MSKVYDAGIQRYRDSKIRVCGKDSIPFSITCKNGRPVIFGVDVAWNKDDIEVVT